MSDDTGGTVSHITDRARAEADEYRQGEDRPLGAMLGLLGVYGSLVTAGAVLVRRRGVRLPERFGAADLALMAMTTHRAARTMAKDPVTSPLRAPFTTFHGTSGEAELAEEVRDGGVRKAVGELVTCPFCLAQWVATAYAFGLITAPRATRVAGAVFTAVTAADFLQYAYAAAEKTDG